MTLETNCLFCKFISGEIPINPIRNTAELIAFRDIAPQAPTHILLVPKVHVENAAALAERAPLTLAALHSAAAEIAAAEQLDGYRLVFNTGASAGQSVFHAHLHLLGGRSFAWPPG
jgi:histidine triad (HIT) family protein